MKDRICHWIARHLPARIIYWAAIHVFANASCTKYADVIASDLTAMDAVKCWSQDKLEPKPKHKPMTAERRAYLEANGMRVYDTPEDMFVGENLVDEDSERGTSDLPTIALPETPGGEQRAS